jgi:hypothetical protein
MTFLIAVGIAACTRPKTPACTTKTDFVQLAAAVGFVCLVLIFLPFVSGLEFSGPESECIYLSCWPQPYQELLLAAPALMAAMTMGACAIIGARIRWWLRACIPAGIYAAATTAQIVSWHSVITIFLNCPSP